MTAIQINVNEVLRYLGAAASVSEDLRRDAEAVAKMLVTTVQPRYTYKVVPLKHEEKQIVFSDVGVTMTGETARTMLAQCDQAVLLACTLGVRFDTMLRAEQARDMARAVILDACGSALVESGCDAVEREIKERFSERFLTDRFSPGYGDLPLTLQPSICTALDTPRRLGVHVTKSLLMNPSKSVTAVIGLSDQPQKARIRGCAYCSMRETCSLRKGGKRCAL